MKKEEGDKLQKELRDIEQKLADQGSAMADDKREALQKTYQEKAIAFKRFQDDANRELEASQKKELGELERRVFPVINQVGKEKGYTLIFNKFQSGLRLRRRRRRRDRRRAQGLQHDRRRPRRPPRRPTPPPKRARRPAPAPAPTKKP